MDSNVFYKGQVRHRRFSAKPHDFHYQLFMLHLDLDDIELLCSKSIFWSATHFNLVQFRRADYLGDPAIPLKAAVQNTIRKHTGKSCDGAIRLLTQLRYWGYCFNPVSFYFCYSQDEQLEYIVAEINNTPWGERYAYVLDAKEACHGHRNKMQFEFDKAFHVSPFLPMDMQYRWVFAILDSSLLIHMDCEREGAHVFDATLTLKKEALTKTRMNTLPFRYGAMCFKIITAIYWQALKLWFKRTPFYTHSIKTLS